jgi:hypothetical protein
MINNETLRAGFYARVFYEAGSVKSIWVWGTIDSAFYSMLTQQWV